MMRTDAEFELWLSQVDQRWQRIFRRATWQMAAITVAFQVTTFALVLVVLNA